MREQEMARIKRVQRRWLKNLIALFAANRLRIVVIEGRNRARQLELEAPRTNLHFKTMAHTPCKERK